MRALKLPGRHGRQRFRIDLHAAVDEVDVRQQLRLGAHRPHSRAELRLAVVREQQVLQQHGLFLGNTELARGIRGLLRPHDQMAEELSGRGILRHDAEIGERKLPLLAEVVQQRAASSRAAVNDLRIQAREEIRRAQHVVSMHQKAGQKTVVHTLPGRNAPERVEVPRQHRLGDTAVIRVRDRGDQPLHIRQRGVRVDGRRRHEQRRVVIIRRLGHTDAVNADLQRTAVLRDAARGSSRRGRCPPGVRRWGRCSPRF